VPIAAIFASALAKVVAYSQKIEIAEVSPVAATITFASAKRLAFLEPAIDGCWLRTYRAVHIGIDAGTGGFGASHAVPFQVEPS
jgi:hypothetical protein